MKLNLESHYPHLPADVWKALTNPEALAKWLLPNNFRPILGSKFQFETADGKIACKVVELKPNERLAFTWDSGEDEPPAVVSWTLQPDGDGGTHLKLEHRLFETSENYVLIEAGLNWRYRLGNPLRQVLRRPVPIVYEQDEPELATTRLAGFRDRSADTPTATRQPTEVPQ